LSPKQKCSRGVAATTNIACLEGDKNVYYSEYGPNTVSVKIASVKTSLLLLAHEFWHAKYEVTNLAISPERYRPHGLTVDDVSEYGDLVTRVRIRC
jgi:hypothetical protein